MAALLTVFIFFILFGLNSCLYRKHFYIKTQMTWREAQQYCREYHDDLSTVSKEEAKLLSNNPEITYAFYWIGLQRNASNPNKWMWSTGEAASIDYWANGEPNYLDEQCGAIHKNSSGLFDSYCTKRMTFYCMEVSEQILVNQNRTWEGALNYCRQHYSDLVSLSTETFMRQITNDVMTAQTAYVWTGLRFMAGRWFWVNGDVYNYKAWSEEGEPQCPSNLRCVALDREKKVWKPRDCVEKLNFICLVLILASW